MFSIKNFVFKNKECGLYITKSTAGEQKKGRFELDLSVLNQNHSYFSSNQLDQPILCELKFIAAKNEKIILKFDSFDVKSLAPE